MVSPQVEFITTLSADLTSACPRGCSGGTLMMRMRSMMMIMMTWPHSWKKRKKAVTESSRREMAQMAWTSLIERWKFFCCWDLCLVQSHLPQNLFPRNWHLPHAMNEKWLRQGLLSEMIVALTMLSAELHRWWKVKNYSAKSMEQRLAWKTMENTMCSWLLMMGLGSDKLLMVSQMTIVLTFTHFCRWRVLL